MFSQLEVSAYREQAAFCDAWVTSRGESAEFESEI